MEQNKIPLNIGLVAHVDAGKTTLSEALLYTAGACRSLGRVDHGNAFLDTYDLERRRGITIFSKQAMLSWKGRNITLVDTPGHVDFSTEAERVLPVLDCGILVLSGTDGVQAHTQTLWQLLETYYVPVFLFINKMDLSGADKHSLMCQIKEQLSDHCIDFSAEPAEIMENTALCDEALLETYLESGTISDGNIRALVENRKLFPCCFGSALKLSGISQFLDILCRFGPAPAYPEKFGARIYKISRDPQGSRLTWMKITGGRLKVREALTYTRKGQDPLTEKVVQLRLYSSDKYEAAEEVSAGTLCAVTGLSSTFTGQGLGAEHAGAPAILQSVMNYRVSFDGDPALLMPKLRQLEEEDPQLHIVWDPELRQIHLQIMGRVQLEVFRSLVKERFGAEIQLEDPRILYKETIANTVEGVGHYEPLRHYAEVHLLLEPLPRGSGLVFDSKCPTDVLDLNFQNLVLTHLAEKTHLGVLTGSPITDMKITLIVGRAHLKHTEGGDFRQATYRAVRQGLMQAKSVLLEPWYRFILTVPAEQIGRAITDIRTMGGKFEGPEPDGNFSKIFGTVPAWELKDYADQVAAYTQGQGRLQTSFDGYDTCHNSEAVIAAAAYDPESDVANTPDSVFCAHGAGFPVKWNQVPAFMHLESGLKEEKAPEIITRNLAMDDRELEAIMEREFGPVKQRLYHPPENHPAEEKLTISPPRQQCLIVDGYNIIFSWSDLAQTAKSDLTSARRHLCDTLSSYAGFKKIRTIVVFDGYKVRGNPGEKINYHNISVVFTRENETGDQYIETLAAQIGRNYNIRVATSDALVQLSSFRSGGLRMSARELLEEVKLAEKEMRKHYK